MGDFGFLSREKRRNRVILTFSLGRNEKNGRFCVSAADDELFFAVFFVSSADDE